jgi:NADH pyrophosphatase NudC (nudix superfamily)
MTSSIQSRRFLMRIEDLDARWHALSEEVMTGMKDWRVQHPKATFREIEAALDERLARLRARMLEDATLVSRATDWEATDTDRPVCPQCGTALQARGRETRTLTTHYDQALQLERRYAMCPRCQAGVFPPG